jgi:hypothetical protein
MGGFGAIQARPKTKNMNPNLPTGETMSEGSDVPPESAGDSLAAAGADSKTISVPADLLPEAKPGDTFKVQSVADGNVTLEHQPGESSEDDWGKGLQEAAPRTDEGMM